MSVRKQVLWNDKTMTYEGFSDAGDAPDCTVGSANTSGNNRRQRKKSKVPIVKDVLVFMVVGHDFRITVAYQFLNGMDAIDRATLTKEVISRVDQTGAKVISLTGDGLHANMTVAKLLGAKF